MKTYSSEPGVIPKIGRYIFVALTAIFAIVFLIDKDVYLNLIREDSIAEWLTFSCLLAAGIISLTLAIDIKKKYNYIHWFFVLFFAFNVLAGFEEISWGQRVFQLES